MRPEEIMKARKAAKLTQQEAAEFNYVTRGVYAAWELGHRAPPKKRLARLQEMEGYRGEQYYKQEERAYIRRMAQIMKQLNNMSEMEREKAIDSISKLV